MSGPVSRLYEMPAGFCLAVELIDGSEPSRCSLAVSHRGNPGKVLWSTVEDGRFLWATAGECDYADHFGGSFDVSSTITATVSTVVLEEISAADDGGTVSLVGHLEARSTDVSGVGAAGTGAVGQEDLPGPAGDPVAVEMRFVEVSGRDLRIEVSLGSPGEESRFPGGYSRLVLRMASSTEEAFFGFGEQLTWCNLAGQLVPLISQEHGIGRGLPMVTEAVNSIIPGAGGTPVATETASAFWHTSEGRSFLVEGTCYGEVDLRVPGVVRLEHHATSLVAHVFSGTDPLDVLEAATEVIGRFRELPSWVHGGVILGIQGGTERVDEAIQVASAAGIEVAGVWLQDWCGRRKSLFGSQLWWDWHLDEELYPGWPSMVDGLRSRGTRVLTYVNPYLSTVPGHDDLYREALERGFLVRDLHGEAYLIPNSDIGSAVVDLSNPEARSWMVSVIAGMAESTGASGWMADFGEGLPMQGVDIFSGDPSSFHNAYPVAWAEVNRDAVDSLQAPEEMLPFNRSGFTSSPGFMTLGWLGDQLQTWDEFDGMRTAVCGMVSGGLSGFSLVHGDVGGYLSLPNPWGDDRLFTRTPELLMRWMELGALSPVFRTHEGLDPASNLQWDSTPEILAHLRRCVGIYRAWAGYRESLVAEAARTGAPVVRHPFLHFPHDAGTYHLRHQYMLGAELMVAPVLDPDVDTVQVYLPAGFWRHLWTGTTYGSAEAGGWSEVPAPLGRPAVLAREDSEVTARIASAFMEVRQ